MEFRSTIRAGVVVVAVITTTAGVLPSLANAAEPGWRATVLEMPAGHQTGRGFLTGTDGKGGYAGAFAVDNASQVVTWKNGNPTVRGIPAGYEFAAVWDENKSGTVLGDASDYDTNGTKVFTLDHAGFHLLPTPAGFDRTGATAINNRGDVLGQAFNASDPKKDAIVLWRAGVAQPVVIPISHSWEVPRDLDDDGTILVNTDSGSYLWKDGTTQPLQTPPGYTGSQGEAIRNGVVVGAAASATSSQAFAWRTPNSAKALPGGEYSWGLNSVGLVVGQEPVPGTYQGVPVAWLGTRNTGRLPLPAGLSRAQGRAVGDDGTIAGTASNGPLDEGGQPVVWRYSVS